MRSLSSTVDEIISQVPTFRSTQPFLDKLVAIRDIAPFIPDEAISAYWVRLTDLVVETLHPEESGLQTWEQGVMDKLLGVP